MTCGAADAPVQNAEWSPEVLQFPVTCWYVVSCCHLVANMNVTLPWYQIICCNPSLSTYPLLFGEYKRHLIFILVKEPLVLRDTMSSWWWQLQWLAGAFRFHPICRPMLHTEYALSVWLAELKLLHVTLSAGGTIM